MKSLEVVNNIFKRKVIFHFGHKAKLEQTLKKGLTKKLAMIFHFGHKVKLEQTLKKGLTKKLAMIFHFGHRQS